MAIDPLLLQASMRNPRPKDRRNQLVVGEQSQS